MEPLISLLSGQAHAAPPLIDFDWTILVQFSIFLVLAVALNFFVFQPYLALLRKRAATMEQARTESAEYKQLAESRLKTYEVAIDQAHRESGGERNQARSVSETAAAQLIAQTRRDAERRMTLARGDLERKIPEIRGTLRARANELAQEIVKKILGHEVSA